MPPAVGVGETIPFEIYDEAEKELEEETRRYLDTMAQKLREQGLPVATSVLMGPPAMSIEEATHLGDVLVLCSNDRRVMRWLLGSVAEKLTREDESPVILVPAPDRPVD